MYIWNPQQALLFSQFDAKAFFDEGDTDNDGFISKREHYDEVSHLFNGWEKM